MTVEDWLVLTNRADIDEKEMVGLEEKFYKKTNFRPINETGETVELVQQELPNWWSYTGRVEAGSWKQNLNIINQS